MSKQDQADLSTWACRLRAHAAMARSGELALGRAEVAPEAPAVDSDPLYDLHLTPEQAVSLKALADLLASPEPQSRGSCLGSMNDAEAAWARLRRQAGLEGDE